MRHAEDHTDPGLGPLTGIRVLELGQFLAGPFAGYMLGTFGADVIKVEPPGVGDGIRRWRKMAGDSSLWWHSLARNKRCITCDLRKNEGRDLIKQLVAGGIDIVIESFRPGRMEAWGLGYEVLRKLNNGVIMVRVSGYGQTGPLSDRPGFANVAEAFGGLRYVTGEPGRPQVRSGISIGDSLAGLHAAFGALAALRERDAVGSGRGQMVDVALYESVFNVMESLLPEYDMLGHVRERCGARVDGITPSNTYPCSDGHIVLGANTDTLYARLMRTIGREDLANDSALHHNDGRVKQADRIDDAISVFTRRHTVDEALMILGDAEIPCGPILSAAAIASDPHYEARGMLESVTLPDGRSVKMPGVVPKLSRTPGSSRWAGPTLGAHTDEVLREFAGLSDEELTGLRERGAI